MCLAIFLEKEKIMNKRPEWILPDLKKAQVRTKIQLNVLTHLLFQKTQNLLETEKNIIFLHMAVRQTKETLKH